MKYDEIGEYSYSQGWCVREAFRQGLADDHPIIGEIPYNATLSDLEILCERYGFEHSFGRFHRDFHQGDSVVWVLAASDSDFIGHTVFCRDPRRVVSARNRGQCIICGYILLEGYKEAA